MSARWLPSARHDLAIIDEAYWAIQPDYADRVGRLAIAAGNFLASYPRAGPPIAGELRKWAVRGTDYVLVYRVVGPDVEILRVHHGREDWRP